jgi:hypothetical protein
MANPSYWVFRRNGKWHSGWRDQNSGCHSRVHPIGAGKALAEEYARKMAVEACHVRAGQPVGGKEIRSALDAFLGREDVKECTHDLNRRHLEMLIDHFGISRVEEITPESVNDWSGHLKSLGYNPGGQRVCRFAFCERSADSVARRDGLMELAYMQWIELPRWRVSPSRRRERTPYPGGYPQSKWISNDT